VPPRYFRDVFPYVMAATALHRSRTAILRPGSGVGQRLRENLVVGLLLNLHGGEHPWPRLDPNTLALIFEGDLAVLFKADAAHPRFAEEFRRLQAAGILTWSEGRLQVMPPDVDALTAHVTVSRVGKAEHWMDSDSHPDEAADALRDALAAIGIDNARRVADAIGQQGSAAYTTPSGAVLTLLTDLAEQGDMATLARAYGLFAKVHPANSRYVRDGVPAKILSVYFTRRLRLTAAETISWTQRAPHWETELKAALGEPSVFVSTVERMSDEIRAAA
jgi:hypothetical protein